MAVRLTKRVVDGTEPSNRRMTAWDSELAGFGLRVEPSGAKTFIIRYRANGGGRKAPERLMTIGRYGMLTVDDARQTARKLLAEVKLGFDPAARRGLQRRMPRFGEIADRMLLEAEEIARVRPGEARLRPGTIRNYRSILKRHVGPAIGVLNLSAVSTGDLARLHQSVGGRTPSPRTAALSLWDPYSNMPLLMALFPQLPTLRAVLRPLRRTGASGF